MPLGAALTWGQLADQGQCRELPQCLVAYVDFPRIKKKKKKAGSYVYYAVFLRHITFKFFL